MSEPAAAQSTIFNIPSTDTVAPKKVYFEFDYVMQLPKPDAYTVPDLYAARRVWCDAACWKWAPTSASRTTQDVDGGNDTIFQPNAKYKFWADDDKGLAAAAGFIAYLPNQRLDKFGLIYGNVSKKIKSGARFTFGGYGAPVIEADDKGGVILGAEVPLGGKVSFVADWFSGKNFFGYFTPGISVALPHSALFNIGYSLGNDSGDRTTETARCSPTTASRSQLVTGRRRVATIRALDPPERRGQDVPGVVDDEVAMFQPGVWAAWAPAADVS